MKLAKEAEIKLDSDPRPMDRATENHLRVMIFAEAIKPTWGCVLYTLERMGRITADQKEAGNRYWTLASDYTRLMDTDPETELDIKRVERVKRRYKEATDSLGLARKYVDGVVIEDLWPECERGHLAVKQGLEMLRIFFSTGTKAVRKKA